MTGRKRLTPEDAATARRLLLDGLARDADIDELLSEIEMIDIPDRLPREVAVSRDLRTSQPTWLQNDPLGALPVTNRS